ncbi:MAG: hypothetical protein CO002_03810, partial [Candidatus Portnoybacteria bacterium CG_4_8_14_3_um_filter_44_10]
GLSGRGPQGTIMTKLNCRDNSFAIWQWCLPGGLKLPPKMTIFIDIMRIMRKVMRKIRTKIYLSPFAYFAYVFAVFALYVNLLIFS